MMFLGEGVEAEGWFIIFFCRERFDDVIMSILSLDKLVARCLFLYECVRKCSWGFMVKNGWGCEQREVR